MAEPVYGQLYGSQRTGIGTQNLIGGPGFAYPGATAIARGNTTGTGRDAINTPGYGGSSLPGAKISAQSSGSGIQFMQFPSDLPKYQLAIIEGQFERVNMIRFTGGFKLPLPTPLLEHYTTQFDQNMNLIEAASSLVPGQGNGLGAFAIGAAGLHVNQVKAVTLKQPAFRQHTFSWKFAPKHFEESFALNRLLYRLKRGMQPKIAVGGVGNTAAVFGFPNVYLMFFVPNIKFMYKFKPCVLQDLVVDYQGGNPAPAFYGTDGSFSSNPSGNGSETFDFNIGGKTPQSVSFTPSDNPPEAVVVKTVWLELETWAENSFPVNPNDPNSLEPSNNPFDAYSYYDNSAGLLDRTAGLATQATEFLNQAVRNVTGQ